MSDLYGTNRIVVFFPLTGCNDVGSSTHVMAPPALLRQVDDQHLV